VAALAGHRFDRLGSGLDDLVRAVTVRADRRLGVAALDLAGVDAAFPLLELVAVAAAARLGGGDGEVARALDFLVRRRVAGEVHIAMAAGAADDGMDRLAEILGIDVQ